MTAGRIRHLMKERKSGETIVSSLTDIPHENNTSW
jgi:hypothetical protein